VGSIDYDEINVYNLFVDTNKEKVFKKLNEHSINTNECELEQDEQNKKDLVINKNVIYMYNLKGDNIPKGRYIKYYIEEFDI
jgi:hypothetical protein